jgi:hypothetical protein
MATENRLGRFILHREVFHRWEDMLPLMGNFVVIEAKFRWDTNCIEYLAYSNLFEPIEEGVAAPEYDIEVALFPDAPAVIKAHRKS